MLFANASEPTAVHNVPEVLSVKELYPIAVLLFAVDAASRAKVPTATFCCPVVFDSNALLPTA